MHERKWNEKTNIAAALFLAVAMSFIDQRTFRITAAALCYEVALYPALTILKAYRVSMELTCAAELEQQVASLHTVIEQLTDYLNDNIRVTPVLTIQLKEVSQLRSDDPRRRHIGIDPRSAKASSGRSTENGFLRNAPQVLWHEQWNIIEQRNIADGTMDLKTGSDYPVGLSR